jgi:translation initiation factor IF-2
MQVQKHGTCIDDMFKYHLCSIIRMPKAKKKVAKKAPARKAPKKAMKKVAAPKKAVRKAKPIGEVTHFFGNISVAVVKIYAPLKVGDKICIEGRGQCFEQVVKSMQVEHDQVQTAKKGQEVGMKVAKPVKDGDLIYKA